MGRARVNPHPSPKVCGNTECGQEFHRPIEQTTNMWNRRKYCCPACADRAEAKAKLEANRSARLKKANLKAKKEGGTVRCSKEKVRSLLEYECKAPAHIAAEMQRRMLPRFLQ